MALLGSAGNGDCTCGLVVDVAHCCGFGRADALRRVSSIGISNSHCDLLAHLSLREGVGATGGTRYRCAVGLPLVAQSAQAISVCQCAGVSSQGLALLGSAGNGDCTCGLVVDVAHCCGFGRADALRRVSSIGISNSHCDLLAHLSLREGVGATGGTRYRCAVGLPLVAQSAQAISVCQCAGVSSQGLALFGSAGYGNAPLGGLVDVGDIGNRQRRNIIAR